MTSINPLEVFCRMDLFRGSGSERLPRALALQNVHPGYCHTKVAFRVPVGRGLKNIRCVI